jgi:hypothetical protein
MHPPAIALQFAEAIEDYNLALKKDAARGPAGASLQLYMLPHVIFVL